MTEQTEQTEQTEKTELRIRVLMTAAQEMLRRDGSLISALFMFDEQDSCLFIAGLAYGSNEEKYQMVRLTGREAGKRGLAVVRALLVSDAWMRTLEPDQPEQRIEVIMGVELPRGGKPLGMFCPYKRDAAGDVTGFEEVQYMEGVVDDWLLKEFYLGMDEGEAA